MGAVHRVWAEDSGHRLCSFPGLESSAKEGKAAAKAQVASSDHLSSTHFRSLPQDCALLLPRDDTVMMVSLSHLC